MAASNATPELDWGPLLSSTLMAYLDSGKLHDQVFSSSALLKWLRGGKRIRVMNGGERLRLALLTEGSGNFKRYGSYEALDTTPATGQTNAFFNWKQAATTVSINGLEKRSNQGEARVRDLAKDKVMQSQATLAENLATDVVSDGTLDANKQITGLAAMLPDDPTTNTTYADINQSTNAVWRNQVQLAVGAGAVNLVPKLRTLFNDCQEGQSDTSAPDGLFMPQAVHEVAESVIVPAIRYSGGGGDGEMSINPVFRGAEMQWDEHVQGGVLYALNSNHIFFFVHRDANFTMNPEGFQRPHNQDAMIAQILFQGNLGTNNRRKLGKLAGIS